MLFLKRTLPLIITFVTGVIMIVAYFTGNSLSFIKQLEEILPKWSQIIMVFTMILGAFSLLRFNFKKIALKQNGWGYSVVLLVGFFGMGTIGLISGGSWPAFEEKLEEDKPYMLLSEKGFSAKEVTIKEKALLNELGEKDPNGTLTITVILPEKDENGNFKEEKVSADRIKSRFMSKIAIAQQVLYDGVFKSASSTMFALLAFFVASASFRAFRIKSKEAGLLMFSAFIVMLGNVPLGDMISKLWTWIPLFKNLEISAIKDWIMAYPSSAAQGAILIGAMLGYVSSSLKIILGVERSHLGGEG